MSSQRSVFMGLKVISQERLHTFSYFTGTGGAQPEGNAPVGTTRLRLQIVTAPQYLDWFNSCPPNFYTASSEDDTVLMLPAPQVPAAGFSASLPTYCNCMVQFTNTTVAVAELRPTPVSEVSTSRSKCEKRLKVLFTRVEQPAGALLACPPSSATATTVSLND